MFRVWGDLACTDRVIIAQSCVGAHGFAQGNYYNHQPG